MSKKGLNSLNEFIECLKESWNVTDNLIKIDNAIAMIELKKTMIVFKLILKS